MTHHCLIVLVVSIKNSVIMRHKTRFSTKYRQTMHVYTHVHKIVCIQYTPHVFGYRNPAILTLSNITIVIWIAKLSCLSTHTFRQTEPNPSWLVTYYSLALYSFFFNNTHYISQQQMHCQLCGR